MFTNEFILALKHENKRVRVQGKQRTRNQLENITEHHTSAVRYPDKALDLIEKLYSAVVGPSFVLMDYHACSHRAAIVDDLLESERIEHMKCPAQSLDLNVNENFWLALG